MKKRVLIINTCFFLLFFEISSKLFFGNNKGIYEYLEDEPQIPFSQQPNLSISHAYPYLKHKSEKNKSKPVDFKTDSFGTIEPTSISHLKASDSSNYIIYCGGSTTESASVNEKYRPPAVVQRQTDTPVVSLALSGKTLSQCISSIKVFLELGLDHGKKIRNIVIANNINTPNEYLETEMHTKEKVLVSSSQKEFIRRILPATYLTMYFISRTHRYIPRAIETSRIKTQFPNISDYEIELYRGCCHRLSKFNRVKPEIDWSSEAIYLNYYNFVNANIAKLHRILRDHRVDKGTVLFLQEPNSFGMANESGVLKARSKQRLYDYLTLEKLSDQRSAEVQSRFNKSYFTAVKNNHFDMLLIPNDTLSESDFIDAVHYTNSGSLKVGLEVSKKLSKKTN